MCTSVTHTHIRTHIHFTEGCVVLYDLEVGYDFECIASHIGHKIITNLPRSFTIAVTLIPQRKSVNLLFMIPQSTDAIFLLYNT